MTTLSFDGIKKLKELLMNDEGYKQFPYIDTTGHMTVGIGRNLTDRGVSLSEALDLLENDIKYFQDRLDKLYPFFHYLSDPRKIVLISMCFNLGVQGLMGFEEMFKAIEKEDFELAAKEMIDSKWAAQVKMRAERLASIMKTGDFNMS